MLHASASLHEKSTTSVHLQLIVFVSEIEMVRMAHQPRVNAYISVPVISHIQLFVVPGHVLREKTSSGDVHGSAPAPTERTDVGIDRIVGYAHDSQMRLAPVSSTDICICRRIVVRLRKQGIARQLQTSRICCLIMPHPQTVRRKLCIAGNGERTLRAAPESVVQLRGCGAHPFAIQYQAARFVMHTLDFGAADNAAACADAESAGTLELAFGSGGIDCAVEFRFCRIGIERLNNGRAERTYDERRRIRSLAERKSGAVCQLENHVGHKAGGILGIRHFAVSLDPELCAIDSDNFPWIADEKIPADRDIEYRRIVGMPLGGTVVVAVLCRRNGKNMSVHIEYGQSKSPS